MEIQYKKTHKESYMIIETDSYTSDYEEKMLRENEIRSLLSFYTMELNGKIEFWYDISGKQSLREYLEEQMVSFSNMEEILQYLTLAYDEIHKYLLREEKVTLLPETIFVNRQGQFRVYLCYCPFMENEENSLLSLFEFILTIVDHNQENLMQMCYEMYDMTTREGTTIFDLLKLARIYANRYGSMEDLPGNSSLNLDGVNENCGMNPYGVNGNSGTNPYGVNGNGGMNPYGVNGNCGTNPYGVSRNYGTNRYNPRPSHEIPVLGSGSDNAYAAESDDDLYEKSTADKIKEKICQKGDDSKKMMESWFEQK